MLKNLVKKFKTHSLDDSEPNYLEIRRNSSNEIGRTRNSTEKMNQSKNVSQETDLRAKNRNHQKTTGNSCPLCPKTSLEVVADFERDSGTESDEELEQIETNSTHSVPISQTSDYYASQQSLSASCRSSHCGSPLMSGFSDDQECSSWDTGFGTNDSSSSTTTVEGVDSFVTPLELPYHHYHTRQQMKRFLKQSASKVVQNHQISSQNGIFTDKDDLGEKPVVTDDPMPTAFVPVRRLRSNPLRKVSSVAEDDEPREDAEPLVEEAISALLDDDDVNRGRSSSLTCCEKRKWSQVRNSGSLCCVSGTVSENQGQNLDDVKNRPLLTAARKTPVKLLIPFEKVDVEKNLNFPDASEKFAYSCQEFLTSKISSPRKKCRHDQCPAGDLQDCAAGDESSDDQRRSSDGGRPSLNFYKMREKLVKPSKKKFTSFNTQPKLKFSASNGYQLRSSRNDFVFRPVYEPTPMPLNATPNLHNDALSVGVL